MKELAVRFYLMLLLGLCSVLGFAAVSVFFTAIYFLLHVNIGLALLCWFGTLFPAGWMLEIHNHRQRLAGVPL